MVKDTSQRPSNLADKFVVRLRDGMRDRISNKAAAANQSMNGWIVSALAKVLNDTPSNGWTPSLDQLVYVKDDDGAEHVGLTETINIVEGNLVVSVYIGNDEPHYVKIKVPCDKLEELKKFLRPVVI